jgi:hypothetical protein
MGLAGHRRQIVAGVVAAALIVVGCGSTSPIAPTSASSAAQYPSLLGHYADEALTELQLQYRDIGATTRLLCDSMADVSSQTDGHFSGGFLFTGGGSREPPCTFSFGFVAEMRPDGTVSNFQIDRALNLGYCTPVTPGSVSGTATHSEIRIVITDRATCQDYFGRSHDTDRIVTLAVKRLASVQ